MAGTARTRRTAGVAALALAAATIVGVLLLSRSRRRGARPLSDAVAAGPKTAPLAAFSLAGSWTGAVTKVLAGPPAREATKHVTVESDADGAIVGASVVYQDPVTGSSGAGYLVSRRGDETLSEILPRIDDAGRIESFAPAFAPIPPDLGPPLRSWRVLEGYWTSPPGRRRPGRPRPPEDVDYVLLESDDGGHLCQIGARRNGFLSWAFFHSGKFPDDARGRDQLSPILTPHADAQLSSFSDLVWDLSGATDFLKQRIEVTVTGPGGGPDALFLMRRP
jgi:hypothetical protein